MYSYSNKTKKEGVFITDTKGHKLVAAIHMVTNHIPDTAPLKHHVRELAILCVRERDTDIKIHHCRSLITLLEAASFMKQISHKNVSVIVYELRRFVSPETEEIDSVSGMFTEDQSGPVLMSPYKKTTPKMSVNTPKVQDNKIHQNSPFVQKLLERKDVVSESAYLDDVSDKKDKRKDDIMSFINSRQETSLKDIQGLYPTLSEKTIQRDLLALLAEDKIAKQGSKRWSLYLPR
ncbi:MAG: hypothetical protein WCQ32_01070 [bacterium]